MMIDHVSCVCASHCGGVSMCGVTRLCRLIRVNVCTFAQTPHYSLENVVCLARANTQLICASTLAGRVMADIVPDCVRLCERFYTRRSPCKILGY